DAVEQLRVIGTQRIGSLQDNRCALRFFTRYTESNKALAKDHPVHLLIESIKAMEGQQQASPPPEETGSSAVFQNETSAVASSSRLVKPRDGGIRR
ncbi:MAG: hypothetical protein AAFQ82_22860, partial [Myxococcota bacterium]